MADQKTPAAEAGGYAHVFDIPVTIEVVLGTTRMAIAELVKLGPGAIVALDRDVGDRVDVVVNGRVVARGDIVVLEDEPNRLGVSLREIAGVAPAP